MSSRKCSQDEALKSHGSLSVRRLEPVVTSSNDHHILSWATQARTGFKNPWSSFHKPTAWEILRNATTHETGDKVRAIDESDRDEVARQTVDLIKPPRWGGPLWGGGNNNEEFGTLPAKVRASWLGHAGVMLQFPTLHRGGVGGGPGGVNVLLDPIFSDRSSPSKSAGPARVMPTPCTVDDLPPIRLVVLSHNHYDHVDLDTVNEVFVKEKENVHFFVPLGNWPLLKSLGITREQVTEADWWDTFDVSFDISGDESVAHSVLRITCTPAQHNSGRWGLDSNSALWSSWYFQNVERSSETQTHSTEQKLKPKPSEKIRARVYFAGDTGLRYRDPGLSEEEWACCPAFQEIASCLGTPDLALLPISVGGTIGYVRSFDPQPAGYSLIPEIPESLTSSTHMTPGDAVMLHKILHQHTEDVFRLGGDEHEPEHENINDRPAAEKRRMISIAMHFGTFCSGLAESRDAVRTLRKECDRQGVEFSKLSGDYSMIRAEDEPSSRFVVLDHGGTVEIPL